MPSLTEVLTRKTRRKRASKPHVAEEATPAVPEQKNAPEAQIDAPLSEPVVEVNDALTPMAAPIEPPKKAAPASEEESVKHYAEFLMCVDRGLLACRRSRCGVKAYPIGGTLGSLTLEQLAERQGWKVTKRYLLHSELLDGKSIAWYAGEAVMLRRAGTHPIWADRGHVERSDHIHDEVLDKVFENG